MAHVTILRSWPDEDDLQVTVEADSGYPDELAEAAKVALDTYTAALAVTLAGNGDAETT